MTQPLQQRAVLRFDSFEVNLRSGELRRNGIQVRLQQKPFDLLVALLGRPDEVVTQAELEARLWPDVEVVVPANLGEAVHKLRKALDDSAHHPRYVETVPTRGYRFIGTLAPPSPAPVDHSALASPAENPTLKWKLPALIAGVALVGILFGLAVGRTRDRPEAPSRPVHWSFQPPERLHTPMPKPDVAISPDGRYIAWADGVSRKGGKVWIRDLQKDVVRPIAGAGPTRSVFWSPDSEFILFVAEGELRRVPIDGGPVAKICSVLGGGSGINGGAVSPDGAMVVFAIHTPSRLYQVPFGGGEAEPLHSEEEFARLTSNLGVAPLSHGPHFLPSAVGNRVLLYSVGFSKKRLVLQDLESGRIRDLGPGVQPVYSRSGHLLYRHNVEMWAAPFSLDELAITGEPFLVRESVFNHTVAEDGTLVYRDYARQKQQLTVRDREGNLVAKLGAPQSIEFAPTAISVDGQRIIYMVAEGNSEHDLWLHDRRTGIQTPLVHGPGRDYSPQFSPDGRYVAFTSNRDGGYDIFLKDLKTDKEEKIAGHEDREVVSDISPDGKTILYRRNPIDSRTPELWYLSKGDDGEWTSHKFLESATGGSFSPDGKYVVFETRGPSPGLISVRAFPDGTHSVPVAEQGPQPRAQWSEVSGEIFYHDGKSFVAVPVSTEPELSIGKPQHLRGLSSGVNHPFPDGQTILLTEPVGEPPSPSIHVVQNWYEEFREQQEGVK